MPTSDTPTSPLESAPGAVGPATTRAFRLLADETRLAILLVLWEDHEPFSEDDGLAFSELMDRVGYETSGNFSYHLDELEGHYVEKTDGGYQLTRAGHRIVRAVVAGTGITDTALEPAEIDVECTICGGLLAVTYENEHLYTVCRECDGRFAADAETPPGTLMGFSFDPAGLANRAPEELFAASVFRAMGKFRMQMGGLCPACSGRVEASLHICEDHESGAICSNCGRRDEIQARWVCTVCKNAGHGPPGGNLLLHPRVIAFLADRGLEVGYDANDFEGILRTVLQMADHNQELLSADPPRVEVTVPFRGDELRLVVDENLSVREVLD